MSYSLRRRSVFSTILKKKNRLSTLVPLSQNKMNIIQFQINQCLNELFRWSGSWPASVKKAILELFEVIWSYGVPDFFPHQVDREKSRSQSSTF